MKIKSSLQQKIILLVFVILALFSIVLLLTNSNLVRDLLMKERVGRLNALLELIENQANDYLNQTKAGVVDLTTAQYYVTESVSKMKFGDAGYFWIQNYDSGLVVKGTEVIKNDETSNLSSKDVSDFRSEDGKLFYREISELAKRGENRRLEIRENGKTKIVVFRAMPDWKWIFATSMEVETIQEYILSIVAKQTALVIILVLLVIGILIFALNHLLIRPLLRITNTTREIAIGNYTKIRGINRNDEIGQLAKSINNTVDALTDSKEKAGKLIEESMIVAGKIKGSSENLQNITADLVSLSNQMSSTSQELKTHANQATESSQEVSSNTVSISSITHQSSRNVSSMAKGIEEVSSSFGTLASAVQEFNASITEISKNTQASREITITALDQTRESSAVMKRLSVISITIGKVVKIIEDIASRTNMLALNASIEAASAGSAGKGFAVVALEVKELAKKTTESTSEISQQIESIQKTTLEASHSIDTVSSIIGKLGEISETIATSVKEQSSTAEEIFKSITSSSRHADSVAKNAAETEEGVKGIAHTTEESSKTLLNITGSVLEVDKLGKSVYDASSNVLLKSKDLEKEVQFLDELTHDLKLLEKLKSN